MCLAGVGCPAMALEMDERGKRHAAAEVAEPRAPGPDPEWRQVEWVIELERARARRVQ